MNPYKYLTSININQIQINIAPFFKNNSHFKNLSTYRCKLNYFTLAPNILSQHTDPTRLKKKRINIRSNALTLSTQSRIDQSNCDTKTHNIHRHESCLTGQIHEKFVYPMKNTQEKNK